jgi:hypothetical protein
MTRHHVIAGTLASLLLSAAAQAQPAPTPPALPAQTTDAELPPIDPAVRAEAVIVTGMIGVDHQSDQLIGLLRGQIINLVMRAGNKSPEDASGIVDDLLMPDFKAAEPELTGDLVDAWARNFSLDELKGLHAFYASPLGQKLVKQLPVVNQEGLKAGQLWGQRVYQAAITKHKDELILRGLKF